MYVTPSIETAIGSEDAHAHARTQARQMQSTNRDTTQFIPNYFASLLCRRRLNPKNTHPPPDRSLEEGRQLSCVRLSTLHTCVYIVIGCNQLECEYGILSEQSAATYSRVSLF